MTTLAADKPRVPGTNMDPLFDDLQMIASDIIYEGAMVGDNGSGYARPLAAADPFFGICERQCDNSAGAAGAKRVKVRRRGTVDLPCASATGVAFISEILYASDDDTFTFVSTSNTAIGKVTDVPVSGTVTVAYESLPVRSI